MATQAPGLNGGGPQTQQPTNDQQATKTSSLGGSEPKTIEIIEAAPKRGFTFPKFSLPEIKLSSGAKKNLKTLAIILGALAALAIIGIGVQYGVHGGWKHALSQMNHAGHQAIDWMTSGSPMPHYGWFAIGGSFLLGMFSKTFGPKAGSAIVGALKAIDQRIKLARNVRKARQQFEKNEAEIAAGVLKQKNEEQEKVKGGNGTTGSSNLMQSQQPTAQPKKKAKLFDSDLSIDDKPIVVEVHGGKDPLRSGKGKNNEDQTPPSSETED